VRRGQTCGSSTAASVEIKWNAQEKLRDFRMLSGDASCNEQSQRSGQRPRTAGAELTVVGRATGRVGNFLPRAGNTNKKIVANFLRVA
jgi:hypothetical protein